MYTEEEEDMFADLEKTLCEGLTNLNFSRNVEKPSEKDNSDSNKVNAPVKRSHWAPDISHIDVTCLENVSDLSTINGPAVRSYNLWKATRAYKDNEYLDSVFFESFAMSLFMRIKFHANKIMESEHHMPTENNLANFLEEKHEDQPEFIDYIDRFLRDAPDNTTTKSIEFNNGTEMMKLCSELPNEWTVIQLCKQVNCKVFRQTRDETLRHASLIFLTLIRYPMSERFDHRPIKIDLNQDDKDELYQASHEMYTQLNLEGTHDYFWRMKDSDFQEAIVSKIKKLLGPWIVCFSGKSRSTAFDDKMIRRVDTFLEKSVETYSKRQNVLICLIARRVYMLTDDDILEAAYCISKTQKQFWELTDFFEELNKSCKTCVPKNDFYPVILVIDEHIDFMFWEMCNPSQEFTRVDSIVTLLKLYFHHQDNITGGYYNVKGFGGSAVINPDLTLPHFTKEVPPFMKILQGPVWNSLTEKKPTFEDLRQMLAHSSVHVYLGHGSGLQFINSYQTCQLSTKAVVFLMGCSSVAFTADHGYAMATAPHHYYHFAKSPAVIGHLNTTYTSYASMLMNGMIGKWFSNTVKPIDTNMFGEDDGYPHHAHKIKELMEGPNSIDRSPYLSRIISELKIKCKIPMVFRAILVHRGLPVQITDNERRKCEIPMEFQVMLLQRGYVEKIVQIRDNEPRSRGMMKK